MARKTVVTLVDDTDNTQAADETVILGLDSSNYTIDLSEKNAKKLRNLLDPWIKSATKVSGARNKSQRNGAETLKTSRQQLSAIRAWASEHGHKVASRGRIPAKVVAAFEAAHS